MPADLPVTPPTLATLIARIQGDIATETGEQDVYQRRTFARGASRAMAAAVSGIYQFAARVVAELLPSTAEGWGILKWAQIRGLTRTPAQAATLTVTFTFTGAATVTDGAVLTRASDGAEYTLDGAVTRGSAGTATGTVIASERGSASALDVGAVLTLSTPVSGVSSTVTVSAVQVVGADLETLPALKTRLLQRLANPAQGGALADYEGWALAASSTVTAAWAYSNDPWLGNVTVRFLVESDGTPDGHIPSGAIITEIQDYIDARCPGHAVGLVTVAAPNGVDWYGTIALRTVNADLQTAIEEALTTFFATRTVRLGEPLDPEELRVVIRAVVQRDDPGNAFVLLTSDGQTPPIPTTPADSDVYYFGAITWDPWPT